MIPRAQLEKSCGHKILDRTCYRVKIEVKASWIVLILVVVLGLALFCLHGCAYDDQRGRADWPWENYGTNQPPPVKMPAEKGK